MPIASSGRSATRRTAASGKRRGPVVDGDVELTPKVITYAFADPALERLRPAQKHLLRMGPKNERAIQAELRALATALGIG